MLRLRLRDLTTQQVLVGEVPFDLVAAETSVKVAWRGFGWAAIYRRPIRVESNTRGSEARIHDFAFIPRLTVVALVFLIVMRRSRP